MSVALITDAQLASGAWKLDGDPFAVVVYTAPDNIPSEGGFAVPVYPVNGWGSAPAPAGDPIGDALRADAVAYWKMDEVSGMRIDATGHGHNLSEVEAVDGVSGKINNAANLNTVAHNGLGSVGDLTFRSLGIASVSYACWFKINNPLLEDLIQEIFCSYSAANDSTVLLEFQISYLSAIDGIFVDLYDAEQDEYGFMQHSSVIVAGEWYFVVVSIDTVQQKVYVSVNNIQESSDFFLVPSTHIPPIDDNASFSIGSQVLYATPTFAGAQLNGDVDEAGLWNRSLTSDERTYLYNSGAGRALFPAP